MLLRLIGISLLVLLLGPLVSTLGCGREERPPCLLGLAGEVQQGPTQGLDIGGELRLAVTDDVVRGHLSLDDGSEADATGSVSGTDAALSFALAGDRIVVAAGKITGSLDGCFGEWNGTLSGPDTGDVGTFQAVAVGFASED